MVYDRRKALPESAEITILDNNTGNTYLITIGAEIGRGGSCIVYDGHYKAKIGDVEVPQSVIIKEFYPKALEDSVVRSDTMELCIGEDARNRFDQRLFHFCEGQAKHLLYASDNADKALPPVQFSGAGNGTFYTVSPKGQGIVLSELDRSSLSIVGSLQLAASICDAIGAIHKDNHKLYLDCKPANLYTLGHRAYLFDFDTVQSRYKMSYCSYSEGWSAPEQMILGASGYADPKKIGFHTDVFSIGTVLFYLLTGEKPSEEDLNRIQGNFEWKKRITLIDDTGALDNVSFLKELDRIMKRTLQKDPDQRKENYGNTDAVYVLKHELENLAELASNSPYKKGFEDTREQISQAADSLEQTIRKNSKKWIIVSSCIGGLILIAVLCVLFIKPGKEPVSQENQTSENQTSENQTSENQTPENKIPESKMLPSEAEIDQEVDEHLLLKLSNANHNYEVGLENWRRRDYNRAERDIMNARTEISEEISQADVEVAKINNSLGCLYLDMGKYESSYDYLNHAYVTFRETYGEEALETLAVKFSIAQYDYYSGDVETALRTLQEISDVAGSTDGQFTPAVYTAVCQFQAQIYDELGDYESAIQLYQQNLAAYDQFLNNGKLTGELANYVNDPQLTQNEKEEYTATVRWIAQTYNLLGNTYLHAGMLDEAQTALSAGLDMCLDNLYIGTKNLTTSRLYTSLARLYLAQGNYKDAEDFVDLAMRIQNNLFDFEAVYPGLVEVYDVYGDIKLETGKYETAEQFYEDAVSLAVSSFGENHPSSAEAFASRGEYYLARDQYSDAEADFEKAIEIRKNILGYQNVRTAQYLYDLAAAQYRDRKTDEAYETITEAKELSDGLKISGSLQENISSLFDEISEQTEH